MSIYKDYDIDDVLLDKPCLFENYLALYPIRIQDRKEFYKYATFIVLSAEHYKIDEDEQSLLLTALTNHMGSLNNNKYPEEKEQIDKLFTKATNDFIELFRIITRGQILQVALNQEEQRYVFVNENGLPIITDWNFNAIRHIILKQNLMFEPTIYEDPDVAFWAEKAKKARIKQNINFGEWEKINIVSCNKQISYDCIRDNYNILQLESDYHRIMKNKSVEDVNAWRKVCDEKGAKKLPNINYTDSIFQELYKNPEESLWKNADDTIIKNMEALQ